MVELEFSDDEIQHIHDQAVKYDCTVGAFLTAIVACLMTELERKDRALFRNKASI